ncbi:MAG: hypothetical protein E3J72_09815 [Planctomycetota bacterium]|nr:MAG: hypothetical protein E3J72_09815 [Planctomycetota bacterium]
MRLNKAGVDLKTMQALMRHSSPVLTLGVYRPRKTGDMYLLRVPGFIAAFCRNMQKAVSF